MVLLIQFKFCEESGEQRQTGHGTGFKTGTECRIKCHDRTPSRHASLGKQKKKKKRQTTSLPVGSKP